MKKLLLTILALFICNSIYANQLTTNYNLEIPSSGTREWITYISKDIISIDTLLGTLSSDSGSQVEKINILSNDAVIQNEWIQIISNDSAIQDLNITSLQTDMAKVVVSFDIISTDLSYYPITIISHDMAQSVLSFDILSNDVGTLKFIEPIMSSDISDLKGVTISVPVSIANGGTGSAVGYTVVSNDIADIKLSIDIISQDINYGIGTWVTKTADYGAQQAGTNGFVVFFTGESAQIQFKTDAGNPPTTVKLTALEYDVVTCPVKKGDYWMLTILAGVLTSAYWIPLGS